MDASIVIPTLGRTEKLARTVAAIQGMAAADRAELVVVHDGGEPEEAAPPLPAGPYPVRWLAQPKAGPAAARNRGAEAAAGELLLFLNDDTRPGAGWLEAHLAARERHGEAILLGRIEWDPERPITPYMAWLAPRGHQFNYDGFRDGQRLGWDRCFGTNMGVPRRWYLEEPSDPAFPVAALEDIEWAYRQHRRGRPIRYVAAALCFHDHRYDGPREYRARARAAGAAARYAARRHPRLAWQLVVKQLIAPWAALAALALPRRRWRERLWELDYRWNYLAGLLGGRSYSAIDR